MNSLDSFKRPQKLITWAKAAIDDAEAAFRQFLAREDTVRQIVEFNPETGRYVFKIVQRVDLPDAIDANATSAINNLRNSFDQSLFAACAAIGKPREGANYPWTENPDPDLERRLKATIKPNSARLKIPSELWDCIRAQQPYGRGEGYTGGDDIVREVSKMANWKHTIGFEMSARAVFIGSYFESIAGFEEIVWTPQVWDPVKKELVLFDSSTPKIDDPHQEHQFAFRITYPQGSPLSGLPMTDTLRAFADKAQSVLDSFKARAIELGAT